MVYMELKQRNLHAVRKYREKLGKEEYLRRVILKRMEHGHQPKQSTLLRYNLEGPITTMIHGAIADNAQRDKCK